MSNRDTPYHDNAFSHMAFIVHEFIAKNNIIIMDHPAYLPDLAPSDFFIP